MIRDHRGLWTAVRFSFAAMALALTSGCVGGTMYGETEDDAAAAAAGPVAAAEAVDWSRPVGARILMSEFAFAPREVAFVAGRPVRLEIQNSGQVGHVFSAPGFFRSVEVRELALLDQQPGPVRRSYDAVAMEELALRAVRASDRHFRVLLSEHAGCVLPRH